MVEKTTIGKGSIKWIAMSKDLKTLLNFRAWLNLEIEISVFGVIGSGLQRIDAADPLGGDDMVGTSRGGRCSPLPSIMAFVAAIEP